MDNIKINDGYEVVAKKVREFWGEHGAFDVVVLLRLDGYPVETIGFCESDSNYEDVTFDNDFWEGEQNIDIELITPLYEVLEYWRDHAKKEEKND